MLKGRTPGSRALALLTIFAIAGTLSSCGRYGRPVRPKAALEGQALSLDEKAQSARIESIVGQVRSDLRTTPGFAPSVIRSKHS